MLNTHREVMKPRTKEQIFDVTFNSLADVRPWTLSVRAVRFYLLTATDTLEVGKGGSNSAHSVEFGTRTRGQRSSLSQFMHQRSAKSAGKWMCPTDEHIYLRKRWHVSLELIFFYKENCGRRSPTDGHFHVQRKYDEEMCSSVWG